jgi:hypothetical protein
MHEDTTFPPYSPPTPFPHSLLLLLVKNPRQDLFYLPVLCSW